RRAGILMARVQEETLDSHVGATGMCACLPRRRETRRTSRLPQAGRSGANAAGAGGALGGAGHLARPWVAAAARWLAGFAATLGVQAAVAFGRLLGLSN